MSCSRTNPVLPPDYSREDQCAIGRKSDESGASRTYDYNETADGHRSFVLHPRQ